jgi:hypothetical protein
MLMIFVVGHQAQKSKFSTTQYGGKFEVPESFHYIERIDSGLTLPANLKRLNSSAESWSEYSAVLQNLDKSADQEFYGLYHYRTFLKLGFISAPPLPLCLRSFVLKRQKRILEKDPSKVYVGRVSQNPWNQYLTEFPENLVVLQKGCEIFDRVFDLPPNTSHNILINEVFLYAKNIFISEKNFFEDWFFKSQEIITMLDQEFGSELHGRWGGYIMERLFSAHISIGLKSGKFEICPCDFQVFVPLKNFPKSFWKFLPGATVSFVSKYPRIRMLLRKIRKFYIGK